MCPRRVLAIVEKKRHLAMAASLQCPCVDAERSTSMNHKIIALTTFALAALYGCGMHSNSQPTGCFGATYECTTQESSYNFSHKRFETSEKHWGCSSWSGSSCSSWLDSDRPGNRSVIDSSRGLHDYLEKSSGGGNGSFGSSGSSGPSFGNSSSSSFGGSSSSSSFGGSSSSSWFKKHGAMSP
jgi:hypothetical protein